MASTAEQVFETAMTLMDELQQNTGAANTAATAEYRRRTLGILNLLRIELYPASDTCRTEEPGRRPVCPEILDFQSEIGLDDGLCQGVMPYGLAAHLLLEEDPVSASYFNQRYEELLAALRSGIPSRFESIEEVYGGIELGEFAQYG
jgi:hypothetical protein